MKKTILFLLLCLFFLFYSCKKTEEFPSDTPDCIKNFMQSNIKGEKTLRKWTNDTVIFWSVFIDPIPSSVDDEVVYHFDNQCDTLCIVNLGGPPSICKRRLNFVKLKEVK
jgi:hypothetical protein